MFLILGFMSLRYYYQVGNLPVLVICPSNKAANNNIGILA